VKENYTTTVDYWTVGRVAVLYYNGEGESVDQTGVTSQYHPWNDHSLALVVERQVEVADTGKVWLVKSNRNDCSYYCHVAVDVGYRNGLSCSGQCRRY